MLLGSISVTHHILNKESRKYFTRTFAMSGTALVPSLYVEGDHRCLINKFAKQFNKSIGNNIETLIEFMKHVPEEDIMEFVTKIYTHDNNNNTNAVWWPIIEGFYFYLHYFFYLHINRFLFLLFNNFNIQIRMQFNRF